MDHNILLRKWEVADAPTFILNWKKDFLNRQQRVKLVRLSLSGLHQNYPCISLLTRPLCEVCSHQQQGGILQQTTTDISNWCKDNKMKINASKTKELVINFSKSPLDIEPLTIGVVIERVVSSNLLGVIVKYANAHSVNTFRV